MFVIMGVATDSRAVGELAGIAIGSTVALCAFVGGPLQIIDEPGPWDLHFLRGWTQIFGFTLLPLFWAVGPKPMNG